MIVTNLHPETSEDNIYDAFEEFAPVSKLHLNHDKYTGYVKGYALLEFKELDDTFSVFNAHKKSKIKVLGRPVEIDYAFVQKPGSEKENLSELNEESNPEDSVRKARAAAASLRERLGGNTRDASPTR